MRACSNSKLESVFGVRGCAIDFSSTSSLISARTNARHSPTDACSRGHYFRNNISNHFRTVFRQSQHMLAVLYLHEHPAHTHTHTCRSSKTNTTGWHEHFVFVVWYGRCGECAATETRIASMDNRLEYLSHGMPHGSTMGQLGVRLLRSNMVVEHTHISHRRTHPFATLISLVYAMHGVRWTILYRTMADHRYWSAYANPLANRVYVTLSTGHDTLLEYTFERVYVCFNASLV